MERACWPCARRFWRGRGASNGVDVHNTPIAKSAECGAGRRLLQSARHSGAVDQGRQERHQVDAAVMLLVRRQRSASSIACAGLQSRQLHGDAGSAGGGNQWSLTSLREKLVKIGAKSGAPWPLCHLPDGRGRGAEGIVPGHSTAHCGIVPTAGCDAGVRRLIVTVFESKRQETCALMAEKAEVCGTDCGKSATPAENHLSIPRLTHDPHCQCGRGGHPDA